MDLCSSIYKCFSLNSIMATIDCVVIVFNFSAPCRSGVLHMHPSTILLVVEGRLNEATHLSFVATSDGGGYTSVVLISSRRNVEWIRWVGTRMVNIYTWPSFTSINSKSYNIQSKEKKEYNRRRH